MTQFRSIMTSPKHINPILEKQSDHGGNGGAPSEIFEYIHHYKQTLLCRCAKTKLMQDPTSQAEIVEISQAA